MENDDHHHPQPPSGDPKVSGKWEMLEERFSVSPTHAALLHTNEILVYGGSSLDSHQLKTPGTAEILDLGTWQIRRNVDMGPADGIDIWCGGHTFLEDGRLLFAGGTLDYPRFVIPYAGLKTAFVYDPDGRSWSRLPDMQLGRWYPTLIRLPDNTVLAIAGLPHGFPRIWLRKQEQYRNEDGWQLLKHRKQFPLYPRLHLLPDGKVFYSGVFNTHFQFPLSFPSALWDPKSKQQNWELYGGNHLDVNREEGISLLLALRPPDYTPRVLIAGGGSHNRGRMILGLLNAIGLRKLAAKYGENTAVESAELMDFGGSSPVWQAEAAMHHRRIHAVGVLLPDGKVLVVGGMQSHNHYMTGEEFEDHMLSGEHGVLTPEMFDPEQHTWTMMAAQQRARLYHSTALLLPDGRVISMGSNPYAGMVEKSIEVFSPPYLFSSERPVVTGTLPESLGYGETFVLTVEKPRQVGQVVLMRPDVITHVTNTDQRLVELEFKVSGERRLEVLSPPSPNHLPNGYALLFVLNNDGVPSIGKFIRVGGS